MSSKEQSLFGSTPRDHEHRAEGGLSPIRRKRNRSLTSQHVEPVSAIDVTDISAIHFNLSQDTNMSSQDINDNFREKLTVHSENILYADDSMGPFSSQFSNDSCHLSQLTAPHPTLQLQMPYESQSDPKQILTIAAASINPFLEAAGSVPAPKPPTSCLAYSRYMFDFEEEELVGRGNFSQVFRVRHRLDGLQYAIKKLTSTATNVHESKRLTKEICALAALQGCSRIVQYFSSWIDDEGRIYIQTELCPFGTLDMFVWKRPELTSAGASFASRGRSLSIQSVQSAASQEDDSIVCTPRFAPALVSPSVASHRFPGIPEHLGWLLLHDISIALEFMHSRGIAHMDLRPANVFITSTRGPFYSVPVAVPVESAAATAFRAPPRMMIPTLRVNTTAALKPDGILANLVSGEYIVKLGDFGHATSTIAHGVELEEGESRYLAREVMSAGTKTDLSKADMFSLGATVYELCMGRQLAGGGEEWHNIRDGKLDTSFTNGTVFSTPFVEAILCLLTNEPGHRPAPTAMLKGCKHALEQLKAKSPSAARSDARKSGTQLAR